MGTCDQPIVRAAVAGKAAVTSVVVLKVAAATSAKSTWLRVTMASSISQVAVAIFCAVSPSMVIAPRIPRIMAIFSLCLLEDAGQRDDSERNDSRARKAVNPGEQL